ESDLYPKFFVEFIANNHKENNGVRQAYHTTKNRPFLPQTHTKQPSKKTNKRKVRGFSSHLLWLLRFVHLSASFVSNNSSSFLLFSLCVLCFLSICLDEKHIYSL